jgi:hypothetical protein
MIMMRRMTVLLVPFILLGCSEQPTAPAAGSAAEPQFSKTAAGGRAGALGVVYVTSQGLYYDTFVSAETLPPRGPFQALVNGTTEYGPGDPGYLGGRWWIDSNMNGIQDPNDTYLLCPLLGPGRTTP